MTTQQTLEAFLASDDFSEAVIKSTKAGFGGGSYKVELFPEGAWSVLWVNQIGNLYESPGVILGIPQLSDGDYQDTEEYTGNDETDNLASALRGTDVLDEIANLMREAVSE